MTLYEKRGRKYYPVRDTDAYDGLENGTWVVYVEKGSTVWARRTRDPTHATMEAMLLPLRHQLAMKLVAASERRPSVRPSTRKEQRAWKAYCDILGRDAVAVLTVPCAYDVVSNAIDAVLESIDS